MSILTAHDRRRLVKILALLGSDQAGERAAAATTAHRIVAAKGLTWAAVISPGPAIKQLPERGTWRATARACLAQQGSLRPWETGFLRDLAQFRRLSVKQRYLLKEIADRVLQRAP
jgi:hypothetical protein